MPDIIKNKKTTYPVDTASIIFELMKKYQLQETDKEFFDKLIKKEDTNGNKTIKIIMGIAEGRISPEELNSRLQQDLKIPKAVSEKLGQDIQNKIINFIKTGNAPKIKSSTGESRMKPKIESGNDSCDPYREIVK